MKPFIASFKLGDITSKTVEVLLGNTYLGPTMCWTLSNKVFLDFLSFQ